MFEELLRRNDVLKLIDKINTNEIYSKKTGKGKYEVIGIFYDAIYKYSILINDIVYYDKYLEGYNGLTIGICFEEQMSEENIEVDKNDVQLKYIITEKNIYS